MTRKNERSVVAVACLAIVLLSFSVGMKPQAQSRTAQSPSKVNALSAPVQKIELSSAIDATLIEANKNEVVFKASDAAMRTLVVKNDGRKLSIRRNNKRALRANVKVAVTIYTTNIGELKDLEIDDASSLKLDAKKSIPRLSLELDGASNANITGQIDNFAVDLDGASTLKGNLTVRKLDLSVDGASNVVLRGSARTLIVDLDGASNFKAQNLRVESADIELEGASKATINANSVTDAELEGASVLTLLGKPQINKQSIDSTSRLHIK